MPTNNLPVGLTRLIGREKEIAAVKQLSARTRLLTLTGSGGAGKTRLAIQVAAELCDDFPDGVWFADLTPLTDAALVPFALASLFDLHQAGNLALIDRLKNFLQAKHLLLVLDNCEHLIHACAQLSQALLTHCPAVKILATSREALNIAGESIYRVPSLALPDLQALPPLETFLQIEAIRLFAERATAARADFKLTDANKSVIASICTRLDGMPLAIELAAARVKTLSVEEIAARLDDRFRLLTTGSRTAPSRQQTLRATMDWSYELLSAEEQTLLNRLSVFAGGWTLDAAEAIANSEKARDEFGTLDLLARLVDKSLVVAETRDGATRYRMLETIRQYAREKLIEATELSSLQARHCDYFVRFAETAEPQLKGPEAKAWMDWLESDYGNIRAVFEYTLTNDIQAGVRLAWSLLLLWVRRGNLNEAHDIMRRLLAHPELKEPNRLRLHALKTIGYLQLYIKDTVATRAYYEEGLSIAKRLEDDKGIAFTLHGMGRLATFVHDYQTAQTCLEASLALYRQMADPWGEALALFCLGDVMDAMDEDQLSRTLLEESLITFREMGDICDTAFPLQSLGRHARERGDYTSAVAYLEECLELHKRFDDRIHRAIATLGLGYNVLKQGDYRRATKLYTEMVELLERRGTTVLFIEWLLPMAEIGAQFGKYLVATHLLGAATALQESILAKGSASFKFGQMYDAISKKVRAQLDETTFDAAWNAGYVMTLDQAIKYALGEIKIPDAPDALTPRQAVKEKFGGLTGREREVAALIAQGKSNREIADALVLSERTVEGHVGNILNKLGFHARTQIATWATQQGLKIS